MTIEEMIDVLAECRKFIPGPGHPVDAAAADYLIGRLRGEPARSDDAARPLFDSQVMFHHGSRPSVFDVW